MSDTQTSDTFPEGPRPGDRHTTFFDDPLKEHLLRGLITVSMELSVTRERVATLEALLVETGAIKAGQADAYQPPIEDAAARGEAREKLIESVLGPLLESLAKAD
ncbi:MAG: hypothetical protein AAF692_05070 [Pseudomonadota bacterium]